MKIVYDVPEHLYPYLEGMDNDSIDKLITLLLEIGIYHKLIFLPKTEMEQNIQQIKSDTTLINDKLNDKLAVINAKLDNLIVASQHSMNQTLQVPIYNIEEQNLLKVDDSADDEEDYDEFEEILK